MVFSSVSFLLYFLPTFLILYYLAPSRKAKNIVLTASSLAFYAWGEPLWMSLLIISATTDFFAGKLIHKGYRKQGLLLSVIINLGLLGFFKYSNLVLQTVGSISGAPITLLNIALPIGISFYTFQTMSYTFDMYRGKTELQKSFLDFLLYVSLFPQLVAGPIVRYRDVADQIQNRQENFDNFSLGVQRFSRGLAKKVLLANPAGSLCAFIALRNPDVVSTPAAWFSMALFSIQIYLDFSGYSDMAIGLGKMIGFEFKENFNYPYISKSIGEFWTRWHMSLGSFFRDYVYIPLGGNRSHFYRNLIIVWFLTGLWHGASWNYVLWGLYFGFFVLIEKLFLKSWLKKMPAWICHVYVIIVMIYGRTIFYFEDAVHIFHFTETMFGLRGTGFVDATLLTTIIANATWITLSIIVCTPIFDIIRKKYIAIEWQRLLSLLLLIASIVVLIGQSYNPFLYFRF